MLRTERHEACDLVGQRAPDPLRVVAGVRGVGVRSDRIHIRVTRVPVPGIPGVARRHNESKRRHDPHPPRVGHALGLEDVVKGAPRRDEVRRGSAHVARGRLGLVVEGEVDRIPEGLDLSGPGLHLLVDRASRLRRRNARPRDVRPGEGLRLDRDERHRAARSEPLLVRRRKRRVPQQVVASECQLVAGRGLERDDRLLLALPTRRLHFCAEGHRCSRRAQRARDRRMLDSAAAAGPAADACGRRRRRRGQRRNRCNNNEGDHDRHSGHRGAIAHLDDHPVGKRDRTAMRPPCLYVVEDPKPARDVVPGLRCFPRRFQ